MNEKIAMGFHTCVDYELVWNESIVEEQIRKHNIHNKDLEMNIDILSESFMAQSWPGRKEILRKYFHEQEEGKRQVLIAELGAELAGYITILPIAKHGPFAGRYPELADFNVFEKFQSKGIGRTLLEKAVQEAEKFSNVVTLGVGLHHGYGAGAYY